MSGPQNSMRTPLGRVRHHGASGEGTGHFIASRWTGIALAVLAPWFVFNAALIGCHGYFMGSICTQQINIYSLGFKDG